MSINELYIELDIHSDSKRAIFEDVASNIDHGYLFVDSEDGQCYLFDKRSFKLKDFCLSEIQEDYIKKDIKKIVIPNSITCIGEYAFYNCSGLTSMTIPNSVTRIGRSAFLDCSGLTSVTIPNSVTSIGREAFCYCSGLTSMTIPNSITSIGWSAFYNCSGLTSVSIGTSIKNIGCNVFYYCPNLKSIIFKGKTFDQVKKMENYPFGVEDESIIKTS